MSNEKVWVYSDNALLRADSNGSSKSLMTIMSGTQLTVIAKKHRWLQVTTEDGKTGWIYKGKVTNTPLAPPSDQDIENLSDIILVERTKSAIDAEEVYTARSIRGAQPTTSAADTQIHLPELSPRAKSYASLLGIQQELQDLLAAQVAKTIDKQHIELFLSEGNIGEYKKEGVQE